MCFAHTPAGKCFHYNLVTCLGIDPVLSASWEIVSLQLAKVSQNGHFPWAGWKQQLCDLVSLSDTSDKREEENGCLSDAPEKVQTILFTISSLKRKTPKPWETNSHLLKIPVKHKNRKMEVRSNTKDYVVLSLLSDYWDTAAGTVVSEGLHCNPCFPGRPSLWSCPSTVRFWTMKTVFQQPRLQQERMCIYFWSGQQNWGMTTRNCLKTIVAVMMPLLSFRWWVARKLPIGSPQSMLKSSLLSLQAQPHTCHSGSPGYKDAHITAAQRDGCTPVLTNLLVPLFNVGVVAWFEVRKISAKFSSGKKCWPVVEA